MGDRFWLAGATQSPASKITYSTREAFCEHPIIPFSVWGLRFDLDLMVALEGDNGWAMTEVSRVDGPDGDSTWFVLDSKANGLQYVGIQRGDKKARALVRAFSSPVYETDFKIEEVIKGSRSRYDVSYTRVDGAPISYWLEAATSRKPPPLRNGNAMNHSSETLLAVIDLESVQLTGKRFRFLSSASHQRRAQSLLGVKIAGAMAQTTTGFGASEWVQNKLLVSTTQGFEAVYEQSMNENEVILQTRTPFPWLEYRYLVRNDEAIRMELKQVRVLQPSPGKPTEIARWDFNPPLPDLRFGAPLTPTRSRAVVSIHGVSGYFRGEIEMRPGSHATEAICEILPSWPSWARERPVFTKILVDPSGAKVSSKIKAVSY